MGFKYSSKSGMRFSWSDQCGQESMGADQHLDAIYRPRYKGILSAQLLYCYISWSPGFDAHGRKTNPIQPNSNHHAEPIKMGNIQVSRNIPNNSWKEKCGTRQQPRPIMVIVHLCTTLYHGQTMFHVKLRSNCVILKVERNL